MATKELTTGKPLNLILGFMFPIFLGNIIQQFYNLTDALIVGRTLGIEALASVGATAPLIFLVISFVFASTQGFTVITAQKFGAGEIDFVKKSFAASVVLSAILTFIITLISTPFSLSMLEILQTPKSIINGSYEYLFILLAGIFATVFYNLSSNVIRALGDSKTPLYFLIISSILNILMDLIFIIKFNLGIKGAAYATVCAQGISTILCMGYMFLKFPILRLKKSDWKIDFDFYMEHLKVGIPMGFQMSVMTLGMVILQFVLNGFGAESVAALTTAMRVDQIFIQCYLALGATMAVFTAQNFGAHKMSRVKEGAKIAVWIVFIINLISIVLISMYSREFMAMFMTQRNETVINLGSVYLKIIMKFFSFVGLVLVFRNVLQGMGRVITPLLSGVAELIARGGCAILFGHYFGFVGLCYATPSAWILGAVVLIIGYRINLKRHIKENGYKTN